MCEHRWEAVLEPHKAIREFIIELRCVRCGVRKFTESCPVIRQSLPFARFIPTTVKDVPVPTFREATSFQV